MLFQIEFFKNNDIISIECEERFEIFIKESDFNRGICVLVLIFKYVYFFFNFCFLLKKVLFQIWL